MLSSRLQVGIVKATVELPRPSEEGAQLEEDTGPGAGPNLVHGPDSHDAPPQNVSSHSHWSLLHGTVRPRHGFDNVVSLSHSLRNAQLDFT